MTEDDGEKRQWMREGQEEKSPGRGSRREKRWWMGEREGGKSPHLLNEGGGGRRDGG